MKKLIKLSLALFMTLSLVACERFEPVEKSIELTDQLNRVVTLEKPAHKIVSSYYISTSLLIALGLEDQLVGIEMKADSRPLYQEAAPQILELPAMGNSKMFNIEECASLQPDLVILPVALKEYEEQLSQLNLPVLFVNPETKEGLIQCIDLIAKATNTEEKANELKAFHRECETFIAQRMNKDIQPKVYFSSGDDLLETAGKNMFQHEMIEDVMAMNVSKDIESKKWGVVSLEQLLSFNPSHIFIEQASLSVEDYMNHSQLSQLDAIKNQQVYIFPSTLETWDTPSPCYVLGSLWMAQKLYPSAIQEDEVLSYAKQFYQQFYGIEITSQMLGY